MKRRLSAALSGVLFASILVLAAGPANAQVTPETVITLGSNWRYLDDGSDQGQAWSTGAFDDSSWASGPAELGYGDDQATEVGYGGNPVNRHPTTYFRHQVSITNPHELINGELQIERDDAAIVYVNGTEVWRSSNLPGVVNYLTYATGNAVENRYDVVAFDGSMLIDGTNTFAVEIHNRGAANSDISFDLSLTADRDPSIPFPGPAMGPDAIEVGAGEPASGDVSANDAPNINYSADPADFPDPGSQGTLTFSPDGTWTWTPAPGFAGIVAVPIQGCAADDAEFCGVRSLTISVRLPTAANDDYETPPNTPLSGNVSANDASNGNGNLTWSLISDAPDPGTRGTLVFNQDGTFTFTPVDSYSGEFTLQYQACDAQNDCGQANLRIAVAAPANIVINEIHFHPECDVSYKPCPDAPTEFIEIHNPEAEPAQVGGWELTDGVEYEFPADAVIAGGGYWVVADDAAGFQSEYGFAPNGEWAGKLSNSGERIALSTQFGNVFDEVTFSDGAATPGAWSVQADGDGDSMQLQEPNEDNAVSYWWTPSSPTPRSRNTSASLTPAVENFTWTVLPTENQNIDITADVYGGGSIELQYRVGYSGSNQIAAMSSADGVAHTATIPASAYGAGDLVRFRVRRNGSTIAPKADDTISWVGTTVVDPSVNSSIPVFEWFTSDNNYNNGYNEQGANLYDGVIAYDGVVYDNIGFRIRGAIARGGSWTKRNWKFKLPDHHAFEIDGISYGLDSMDLQGGFADEARIREVMGHTMADEMGLVASQVQHIRMQLNGEFFGLHTLQEHPEGGFLDDNDLDNATLYKTVDGTYEAGPSVSSNTNVGNEIWDIPDYINMVAAASIIQNNDFAHGNFYFWYDADEHERYEGMVWDLDLSQGIRYSPSDGLTTRLENGSAWSYVWHRWKNQAPIFNQALSGDLREMYLRRLRTLADEWYGTGRLETLARDTFAEITGPNGTDNTWNLDTNRWNFFGGQNYSQQGAIDRYANQWIDQYYAHIRAGGPNNDIPGPQPANPNLSISVTAAPNDQRNEHIRITNNENTAIDLSGWRLAGSVNMVLPPGSVIPRGDSAYVVDNDRKAGFRAVTNNLHVLGEYGAELNDVGGQVALIDNDGQIQENQQWGDVPTPGLILNEWNAVSSGETIINGDTVLGNIPGNGGDWIELIVVDDRLDARGWELEVADEGQVDEVLTLSNNAVWSNLRVGTIITIAESTITAEDGTVYAEDASYDPAAGDFWIHVVAGNGGSGQYITATNYKVSNDDWQLSIYDTDGTRRFGPAGEGIGTLFGGGIEKTQIGELEQDPSDQVNGAAQYGNGDQSTFSQPNGFGGGIQNLDDLRGVVTPPTEPGNLQAAPLQREITLTWEASVDDVGVVGYKIVRDGEVVDTVDALTFTDNDLTPGTPHTYEVRAFDGNGNESIAATIETATLPLVAPDAPPNFAAQVNGPVSITVSWDQAADDVGIVGYELSRDGQVIETFGAAGRSYTDTDLVEGQSYDYSVVAIDTDDLRSDPAELQAATRPLIAPTTPGNLAADTVPGPPDAVVLTWTESSDELGVDSYEVTRDGAVVGSVGADVLTWTDNDVVLDTTYAYEVLAVDTDNVRSDPAAISATTRSLSPPDSPPNFVADNEDSIDSIALTWDEAPDDVGTVAYELWREGELVDTFDGETRRFVDTGLNGGLIYDYQLIAIDGDSLRSAAVDARENTRILVGPSQPPNFRVDQNGLTTSLTLRWSASSDDLGVAAYEISRDNVVIATLGSDAGEFVDTGLTPGTSYVYRIVARDGDDLESPTASATGATPTDPSPTPTPDPGAPEPPAAPEPPGAAGPSEVARAVTCLAGNGRIDTNIVNTSDTQANYRITVEGLSPRARDVAAGDWWRTPVTGRADGVYAVSVTRDGVLIDDTTVTVACDGETPMVTEYEVQVVNSCRAGNGYLLFQFANPTATQRGYVIQFEGVPNRSTSAQAYGGTVRAVTGRPDGDYDVLIRADGRTLMEFTATVECDA